MRKEFGGHKIQPLEGVSLRPAFHGKKLGRKDALYFDHHLNGAIRDGQWKLVRYGETGRVMLTTLTKEFFMPRFLERDEAIRRAPIEQYPWDGVAEVRPFGALTKKIVEGVY